MTFMTIRDPDLMAWERRHKCAVASSWRAGGYSCAPLADLSPVSFSTLLSDPNIAQGWYFPGTSRAAEVLYDVGSHSHLLERRAVLRRTEGFSNTIS